MTRSLFDPIPPVLNRSIQELGADTMARSLVGTLVRRVPEDVAVVGVG